MKKSLVWITLAALTLAACTPAASHTPTSTPMGVLPTLEASATSQPTDTPVPTGTSIPTATAVPTLGIGSTITSKIDGMELLYVPAGSFTMGYNGGYPDEGPQHTVRLDAYWIDKTEVTNTLYGLCVQAGTCKPPAHITANSRDVYFGNPQLDNYPVIFVSWNDAHAYCTWAGRQLPTEAQWEKAARGPDGGMYPWGNAAPNKTLANYDDIVLDTTAAGAYPAGASPYGALDMAGNVWEWTAGWYSSNYYSQSPPGNPPGPSTGTERVLRGGSWVFDAPGLRASYRLAKDPTFNAPDVGFRCALPVP